MIDLNSFADGALAAAEKLGKELRECIQNQDILYKQMERANKECNKYQKSYQLCITRK
ncbi:MULTISPECIES: hypothetical protein [Bacillus cereus group]|uniref:hypothetical protein n=1 Tax=Bacillus cereus group TaxID=86661 RepID=UPI0029D41938|nr:hypothetical protein [Bacillus cereus]